MANEMSMFTAVLTRQLAYTTLPCDIAPKVLADMGMVPPSPEGEEAEHREGHRRKNVLVPLVAPMAPMVKITSELLARAILEDASRGYSEEERDALQAHYQTVILQSLIGIVAQLLDMKVLSMMAGGANEFLG